MEIAILLLALPNMLVSVAVSPIMNDLVLHFGKNGDFLAKFFLIIPSLVIVPFLLFSYAFVNYFSKKKLVMWGLIIYIVSGLGCLIFDNIYLMMMFRSLVGISAGLVIPYTSSLITDYYVGEKRYQLLSYAGLVSYVGGILILIFAGLLSKIDYKLVFLIYFVAAIPLFFVMKYLPDKSKKYSIVFRDVSTSFFSLYKFKIHIWRYCFYNFFITILGFVFFYNLAFLMNYKHVGGPLEISITQSFYMLGGILSNYFMYRIKLVIGSFLHVLQMFFVAQGFFLLLNSNLNVIMVYIAGFLIGVGYGSIFSSLNSAVANKIGTLRRVSAISMLTISTYLGQFVSPLFFDFVIYLFKLEYYGITILISGVFYSIFGFFLLIRWIKLYTKATR